MSNIIGEGFKTFVSEQIEARQKILGNINTLFSPNNYT